MFLILNARDCSRVYRHFWSNSTSLFPLPFFLSGTLPPRSISQSKPRQGAPSTSLPSDPPPHPPIPSNDWIMWHVSTKRQEYKLQANLYLVACLCNIQFWTLNFFFQIIFFHKPKCWFVIYSYLSKRFPLLQKKRNRRERLHKLSFKARHSYLKMLQVL